MLAACAAAPTRTSGDIASSVEPHVGAPIDANGNLTADGTRTLEWDARNQLVAVNVGTHRSEFSYDGEQRRVRIRETENGVTASDIRLLGAGSGNIAARIAGSIGYKHCFLRIKCDSCAEPYDFVWKSPVMLITTDARIPSPLSPRVSVAAAIALILVANVGFFTGFVGGRAVVFHHSAGAVLAALLVALTALLLKRELDNPVTEPPPFLAFAEGHVGLGLMLVVAIMLASLGGFWIGQARTRQSRGPH